MDTIHEVSASLPMPQGPDVPGLPPFNRSRIGAEQADSHIEALRSGEAAARCSLWWSQTPLVAGARIGLIGHFAAVDAQAGGLLLEHACRALARAGAEFAVGPMDGSTWRGYRLVTERGSEPPFFLEPDNPDFWPACFTGAGFGPLADYLSALCADLTTVDPRLERVERRMEILGVRIRRLQRERLEEELKTIHALSLISFRDNYLYTPIDQSSFLALYEPLLPRVEPEFVLMAEHEGRLAGFLFAVPDFAQAARGVAIDTVVVKTAAVLPGRSYAGLGGLLAARCHAAAREMGFRRAIHALMHRSNESGRVSAHYTEPFRGYTLFGKSLARLTHLNSIAATDHSSLHTSHDRARPAGPEAAT